MVTVRDLIKMLETLPEAQKDLPFEVCTGGFECSPTTDFKLYVQPKFKRLSNGASMNSTYVATGEFEHVRAEDNF
jgi:hypothetical protein